MRMIQSLVKSKYVIGIALVISIFVGTETIHADCICGSPTPAEVLDEADIVFMGLVVDRSAPFGQWGCNGSEPLQAYAGQGSYTTEFEVKTVWKGSVSEITFINTSGECGADFSRGEAYLVYAYNWEGRCTRHIAMSFVVQRSAITWAFSARDRLRNQVRAVRDFLLHRHPLRAQPPSCPQP